MGKRLVIGCLILNFDFKILTSVSLVIIAVNETCTTYNKTG